MNVTCTGCPAKYAVPDEKVRGKKVRITCKHCGTNIVVDGTAADPSGSIAPTAAAQLAVAAKARQNPPPLWRRPCLTRARRQPRRAKPKNRFWQSPRPRAREVMFIVGFPDDRQHPHTVAQIVDMYSAGTIRRRSVGVEGRHARLAVALRRARTRSRVSCEERRAPNYRPCAGCPGRGRSHAGRALTARRRRLRRCRARCCRARCCRARCCRARCCRARCCRAPRCRARRCRARRHHDGKDGGRADVR